MIDEDNCANFDNIIGSLVTNFGKIRSGVTGIVGRYRYYHTESLNFDIYTVERSEYGSSCVLSIC